MTHGPEVNSPHDESDRLEQLDWLVRQLRKLAEDDSEDYATGLDEAYRRSYGSSDSAGLETDIHFEARRSQAFFQWVDGNGVIVNDTIEHFTLTSVVHRTGLRFNTMPLALQAMTEQIADLEDDPVLGIGYYQQITVHSHGEFFFQQDMKLIIDDGSIDIEDDVMNESMAQIELTKEAPAVPEDDVFSGIFSKEEFAVLQGMVDEIEWECHAGETLEMFAQNMVAVQHVGPLEQYRRALRIAQLVFDKIY